MKKKLFSKFTSVLLAVVMTVGIGAVSFGAKDPLETAWENMPENATYHSDYNSIFGADGIIDLELKKSGDNYKVTMIFTEELALKCSLDPSQRVVLEYKNGEKYEQNFGTNPIEVFVDKSNMCGTVTLNGKTLKEEDFRPSSDTDLITNYFWFYDNTGTSVGCYLGFKINDEFFGFKTYSNRVDKTPETQTLSATFAGSTTTQYGDYEVAVAGSLTGEFQEGENVLTKEQINEQTMYVVIRNKANGEVVARKQNSASVKDTTVKVSNGQVVSVTVGGQANTANGRKDNYSVTMPVQ